MSRSARLFEIIQLLRSADRPMTAAAIGEALEVTKRTIYRDIAALQAMRVPIEGEAGIGYIMRPGFDLPPIMFDAEELEAVMLGLELLARTGDSDLLDAAERAARKITEVLPDDLSDDIEDRMLYASNWHDLPEVRIDLEIVKNAIRDQEKLRLEYRDAKEDWTRRVVKPLAIVYYVNSVVLAAWCELRRDFRHFRLDRIADCKATARHFKDEGETLRARWRAEEGMA